MFKNYDFGAQFCALSVPPAEFYWRENESHPLYK